VSGISATTASAAAQPACTTRDSRCGLCRRTEPLFARALAYGSYTGGLRDLIHLLKYERVRPAAKVLGRMLSEVVAELAESFGATPPVVVPVPLYSRKLHERGFNQSELVTRVALKLRPAGLELALKSGVLKRLRPTLSQTGLTREQRVENVRGAFSVVHPEEVRGRSVLIVDDVFTTGTTVSECARILLRSGATKVWVATVARTLKHEAVYAVSDENREMDGVKLGRAAHG